MRDIRNYYKGNSMINTDRKFKVGYNFDKEFLHSLNMLNNKYNTVGIIDEIYCSIRQHAWLAARPDFRIPDISVEELKEHNRIADLYGITMNYTLNSINPGTRLELADKAKLITVIEDLRYCGIKRVTVSSPLIIDILREISGDEFEVELSTILHIDNVSQIRYMHEQYNLKKVCIGIHKNRTFKWLKTAANYANANGIELELLSNEFCANGGDGYTTHCAYRDSCYLMHATDITQEDVGKLNNYPMQHCIASRDTDPVSWLRTRFIRPQDTHYYTKIGINKFKISGRTGSTEYLTYVAEAYISGVFNDNLLKLWKPLETITSNQNELDFLHSADVPADRLDGFLDRWADEPLFDCANEQCGVTCTYCHKFYEERFSDADNK